MESDESGPNSQRNVEEEVDSRSVCTRVTQTFLEDEEDIDGDFFSSDESDREACEEVPKKRRKKERKVPLSEEEAERKRVLANSQERERMDRLNRALTNLRKALPPHFSLSNRRLSKIRTLRLAIRYIQHLSNMLAHDNAMKETSPGYPPFLQPYPSGAHPGYWPSPLPPQPWQQPLYQSSPFAPNPNFLGDCSAPEDEGYFSSFHDSQRQDTSFLGTPHACFTPSNPVHYHNHNHHHHHPSSTVSPDEGYGRNAFSFTSPLTDSSMFSPDGYSWLSSTPAGGHLVGNFVPEAFEGGEDECRDDTRNRVTFLEPDSASNGTGMGGGDGDDPRQTVAVPTGKDAAFVSVFNPCPSTVTFCSVASTLSA